MCWFKVGAVEPELQQKGGFYKVDVKNKSKKDLKAKLILVKRRLTS